ncbi:hypothetical protein FGL85_07700 [Leuconostoc pseudomesenteroides]|jgi:hypothetical protein|uniref:Uncharacterized protein n=1 Tax=Leuconostoc pseudomesenteroides TaxID=33968 RepID=A0A5B8T207_LEUPS|nr:hypothetical protein [Leuconostoc pseudomesenteroides]MBS0958909.1 hypothetical protein [Leuconostoc pseudomesenteroides]MCT4380600.1 hypothetical protein [Leuconostoc pseudomesenteroides]QEA42394.1 hypothetical protein FGL85_07700 [Leuconostoc pseudomesenteroides]TOZ01422.1 hypothetical protein DIS14_10570 [Leuconostoc pseudomesenteroides]
MGNFILFLIFGFGIAFLYVRHNRDFEALDDLGKAIYKTKDLAFTMPQASDLSKDIQDTTGVITGKTVTVFDKKQLTLKIEASDYTITVILDKKRNVVRFDVTNRGQVDD